jgi:chromosome segregation ATPase
LDSDDQTSGSHSLLADLPPRLPPRVLSTNVNRSSVTVSQSSGSTSSSSSAMGFRDRRTRASPLCSSPVDDDEIFCLRPNLQSNASTRGVAEPTADVDGSISEVEQILREKDNEIAYLRETLEQNEQVIFKVYEEKENAWKRELSRLRNQLEASQSAAQRALQRQQQQIAQQMQQMQSQQEQIALLQQRLRESKANESDSLTQLQAMQQKSNEQSQLIDSAGIQLQQANDRISKCTQDAHDARHLSEKLAAQLASAAEQRVRLCNRFANEQQKWMDEKREVITYHKQMQAAHVRTQQRNKQMEMELQARLCSRCMQTSNKEQDDKNRSIRPATPINSSKQLKVDSMQSALPVTCE